MQHAPGRRFVAGATRRRVGPVAAVAAVLIKHIWSSSGGVVHLIINQKVKASVGLRVGLELTCECEILHLIISQKVEASRT